MASQSEPSRFSPVVSDVNVVDSLSKSNANAADIKQIGSVPDSGKKNPVKPTASGGKSSTLKTDSTAKAKASALTAAEVPKPRRRVGKVTVVPKGYRFFRVLVNGFKQSCHAFVKEKCNLRQFRKAMFECQRDHPQAISEGAWNRAVILKSKPTTMKTNCCLDMNSVLQDDPDTYISSMPALDCVHIYMLCPGPPLPKEFPGSHMRLAKRDTRVCEAHGKQERRALRRTGGARTSHANRRINAADVLDSNAGGDSKKLHSASMAESSTEEASMGVVLAGPLVAAALASGDNDEESTPSVVAPPTFPIQFNPNDPPVICSVQQTTFDGPHSPSDTNSDTSGDEKGFGKRRNADDGMLSGSASSDTKSTTGGRNQVRDTLLSAALRGAGLSKKRGANGEYDDSDTDSVSSGDDCGGRTPKYRRTAQEEGVTANQTLAGATMAAARLYCGGGDIARSKQNQPATKKSDAPSNATSTATPNAHARSNAPADAPQSCTSASHGPNTRKTSDSGSRALCCVPGCGSVASLDVIGNTMVFPRHFDRRGEEFLFCGACVEKFNAIALSQTVMEYMASCPHQHVHETHLDFQTTPKTGPLRYGRLAGWGAPAGSDGFAASMGTSGSSAVFFCSCIREACGTATEKDTHALHAFLAYLAMGLRPTWKASGAPEVLCTGSTSAHIHFPPRPNRILLSVEVLAMDAPDRCVRSGADDLFQYFGENFEDCIHVVPGFPVDKTDYMVEGLESERRYAVRTVETIAGARGVALQLNMRRLCTVPSKHVVVHTNPDMPRQKPYISLQPQHAVVPKPAAVTAVVAAVDATAVPGDVLGVGKSGALEDKTPIKADSKPDGGSHAMDMLLHLAHVATSENDAAVMMFGDVGGRHSFAVPVRVDHESSQRTDPVVAQTHRRGDQFTVFPQVVGCLSVVGGKRDTGIRTAADGRAGGHSDGNVQECFAHVGPTRCAIMPVPLVLGMARSPPSTAIR
eukprot:m.858684 g.858684  ORF g.858684 m.858684 type:complete len:975 (-) comp23524_c0_seq1:2093-5017(-)